MMKSFVRGKWKSPKECGASMLLAKCCHDIDLMMWFNSGVVPFYVSSFGNDFQFTKDKKPKNAGTRCLNDCKISNECHFSAEANYIDTPRWDFYAWEGLEGQELTEIIKSQSLKTDNEYGKCVWECNRDKNIDHQSVNVFFANGSTGMFNLVGGASKSERNIHIIGTKGEIKGVFDDSKYVLRNIAVKEKKGYTEKLFDLKIDGDKSGMTGGHGGGDLLIVQDFLNYVSGNDTSFALSSVEDSLNSHLVIFAADKAMRTKTVQRI